MKKRAFLPLLFLTACAHHVDERYERREVYGQPPIERYERREVYRPPVHVEHHEYKRDHNRNDYGRGYPVQTTPVRPVVVQPVVVQPVYSTRPVAPVVQSRPVTVVQPAYSPRPIPQVVQSRPATNSGYRPVVRSAPRQHDGGHGHHH